MDSTTDPAAAPTEEGEVETPAKADAESRKESSATKPSKENTAEEETE